MKTDKPDYQTKVPVKTIHAQTKPETVTDIIPIIAKDVGKRIKDEADKALDANPKVKDGIEKAAKAIPTVIEAVVKVNEKKDTGDKIKTVADSVSTIIDSVKSAAQTGSKSQDSIMEKFPEDFDIRDELKLDKEVYKFTGNQFDLKEEL